MTFRNKAITCALTLLPFVIGRLSAQDLRVPTLVGRSLNDVDVRIPTDLPPATAILIFTFAQEQQADADRWVQGLLKLKPECAYLEVAVIKPVNAFVRGMIGAGMRRGIQGTELRSKFITVFTPIERVAAELQCSKGTQAVCLVTTETSGLVKKTISGGYNDEDARSLITSLSSPNK